MPTFTERAERIVMQLGGLRAFDRKSDVVLKAPGSTVAATPLVNAGALDKASVKPRGGSQRTIYWLTSTGQEMARSLRTSRRCRICHCSDMNACPGGCHWVAPDLCSMPSCVAAAKRGAPKARKAITHV